MNLQWYDWVGVLGTLLVVASYFLMQSGRLSGTALPYQLVNIVGPCCILASLAGGFNLAVCLLQFTWILISFYGIVRGFKRRASAKASKSASVGS